MGGREWRTHKVGKILKRKSLHKVSVLMLTNSILENLLVCIVSIWQNIMSTNTPRNLFPSTMEELGEGTDFNYCDGQPFLSTANQHYHHNNCYGNHDLLTVDSPCLAIMVDEIRESIIEKSHVSMDTFCTPHSPPPQVLRTLEGVFFLQARTGDSR